MDGERGSVYFSEIFSGVENSRGSSLGKDVIEGRRETEFLVSSAIKNIIENALRLRAGCAVLRSRVMVFSDV